MTHFYLQNFRSLTRRRSDCGVWAVVFGLVRDDRHEAPPVMAPFGEVQQHLLLSCLTIGKAYAAYVESPYSTSTI